MARRKRASMREGPLADLFRSTVDDAPADPPEAPDLGDKREQDTEDVAPRFGRDDPVAETPTPPSPTPDPAPSPQPEPPTPQPEPPSPEPEPPSPQMHDRGRESQSEVSTLPEPSERLQRIFDSGTPDVVKT